MKKLLIILLTLFSFGATAQITCDPTVNIVTCSTCTTPRFYSTSQGVVISGSNLWVNWDNSDWGFPSPTECSKGISFLIDGVEYFANSQNYVYPSAASGVQVPGYVVVPGATICVVLKNYCTFPYTCDTANYALSVPMCVTSPVATPTNDCKCTQGGGKKYKMTKPGLSTACVNKFTCQTMLSQGWSNSCNCQ
jgi:hypothetical protein